MESNRRPVTIRLRLHRRYNAAQPETVECQHPAPSQIFKLNCREYLAVCIGGSVQKFGQKYRVLQYPHNQVL